MDLSKGITLGASYFEWYVMDIKKPVDVHQRSPQTKELEIYINYKMSLNL